MNPLSPMVCSALKGIYGTRELDFVSLEKQCEAGGEAGRLPSDLDEIC